MAVTFGFYNSLNGDRRYDAVQMAEIFDGIINDGVYQSIGDRFQVSPNSGFDIKVGEGRAWFKHSWTKNDAIYILSVSPAELLLDRIDAVVIEVNRNDMYRTNSIKIVKGTPSSSPQRPTLAKGENGLYQYPLAYINVTSGLEELDESNITNMVGTSECPFVTGPLQVMNIDMFITQWDRQWTNWFNKTTSNASNSMNQWMNDSQFEFNLWFDSLQTMLDGDVALKLSQAVLELQNRFKILAREYAVYETIDDTDNEPIEDSYGGNIEGGIVYVIKERS